MSLSIGIVGLPNVGKSTLFNALLKQQVALAANYPFATIDPNVGVAEVPDSRLAKLAEVVHTAVIKPALVEFVDIAGLVKGASAGAGLGNKFLANIRETSAICHVLRAFADADIIREGSVDPVEDLNTVRTELQLADLDTLQKQKEVKGKATPLEKQRWQAVQQLLQKISLGKPVAVGDLSEEEQLVAKELCLLSIKPELIALNVAESDLSQAQTLAQAWSKKLNLPPTQIVIISAKVESELSSLAAEDQALFMSDLGVTESGLERLAAVAYVTLGLRSFLTAGEKEVRAWTIKAGQTAVEAAGVIHTDFSQKFIKAHVANYEVFLACHGWNGVREQGKLRQEGRDYIMQDGDVVEFMIGK